ncbi:MAG: hypothetical protein LBT75_02950, partial [Bacilli bacterium]|nr:hypothetical protein [Bacilli bacterium]
MKLKKNILFFILLFIVATDFTYRYSSVIYLAADAINVPSVCFAPNICFIAFVIIDTEKYQHIYYYLKTRLSKNYNIYLKMFKLIFNHCLIRTLIFISLYVFFFIATNKQEIIPIILLFLVSLYLEVLIIKNILILHLKPRSITMVLIILFFITWIIENLFHGNPLIDLIAIISPFALFPTPLILIRLVIYTILFLLFYAFLKNNEKTRLILKKLYLSIFKFLVLLSFFLLVFNIYTIGRIKDMEFYLFYSHELYQNLFEYMMFNFIIYFTINLKTGLFCFNMKSGMQRYFQYRIISR